MKFIILVDVASHDIRLNWFTLLLDLTQVNVRSPVSTGNKLPLGKNMGTGVLTSGAGVLTRKVLYKNLSIVGFILPTFNWVSSSL